MNNYSPESILINKQEKGYDNEEHKRNLEIAHKKAVNLLDDERIDPKDFEELYNEQLLAKHKKYVNDRQEQFKANNTPEQVEAQKYATVLEAIIHDQIDMNGWLGEHAIAKKASWYDDLKNGIDEIVEFEQTEASPTAHLALGVDVTFGNGIIEKMNNIKARIDRGEIGDIQYLLTGTYTEVTKNVPRVIIGVDMKNLNAIIKLWVNNKKKVLAEHRVKFMILSQIIVQLNDFSEYAEKVGQPAIADSFNRVLKIVENIWDQESKKSPDKNGDFNFEDDRVCSVIRSYCDDLNK